jgi:aspartate aminotransferase-like enzyme
MESAVANLCGPGDRVAVVSHGSFGERWVAICEHHGLDVQAIRYDWGETPDPVEVGAAVRESGVEIVFCQQSDTSTGVVSDVRAIKQEVGDALLVVDAISSLGAVPLETDAWEVDVVVSGSQKALMCPPGLATVSVSDAAYAAAEEPGRTPSYYFNWLSARKALADETTSFTPAVSLIIGLNVALGLLLHAGLDERFELHRNLGRACRAGIKAMGLELFSPDEDRSAVVTAVKAPEGIDGSKVVSTLRDRFGIQIIGGQGALKGKIFRIGHIGYFDVFDITTALAATELVLADMGADITRGVAVTAALEAYA